MLIFYARVGPIFVKYSLNLFAISLFPVIILPFRLMKDDSCFFVIILFVIRLITSHVFLMSFMDLLNLRVQYSRFASSILCLNIL